MLLALDIPCGSHTAGQGKRSGGMSGIEDIMLGFLCLGEAAHPAELSQSIETFSSSGEDLVDVCLMAHVPYYFVFRAVKDLVKGYGQLNNSQI